MGKIKLVKWYGENDVDASYPTFWAYEGMNALYDNVIMPFLVNMNYESYLAEAGDTINITKPQPFTTQRAGDYTDKTLQDAKLDKISAVLDNPYDITFILKDRERSLSNEDLITRFASPAAMGLAQTINRKIFMTAVLTAYNANQMVGGLGTMSGTNARDFILDAGLALNNQRCPDSMRTCVWTPQMLRYLQEEEIYFAADKRGDGGRALQTAKLGMVDGFSHFITQAGCSISGFPTILGAVDHTGGYAKGTTGTLTVDSFTSGETGNIKVGAFVTIANDNTPYRITDTDASSGGECTGITLDAALRHAVADNSVITVCYTDAVNYSSGYLAGESGWITLDMTVTPQVGQLLTFGANATGAVYGIIGVDTTNKKVLLDRALAANVANDAQVNLGPNGEYGVAMRPDFVTFYSRPQVINDPRTGAMMHTLAYNNIALRAALQTDVIKKGMIVTYDVLCGASGLDSAQGTLILG